MKSMNTRDYDFQGKRGNGGCRSMAICHQAFPGRPQNDSYRGKNGMKNNSCEPI